MSRAIRWLAFAAAVLLLTAQVAFARPGGGSSFKGSSRSGSSSGSSRSSTSSSGGSRSTSSSSSSGYYSSSSSSGSYSSGGSSSSGGGVVAFIFIFLFVLIVIVVWVVVSRRKPAAGWSTVAPIEEFEPYEPPESSEPRTSQRAVLLGLQQWDPNFSLVLFDDFLVALYTEIKTAQGRGQLARYQPYLSPGAAPALGHPGGEITSVIVGSASIEDVRGVDAQSPGVSVKIAFETNYSIRGPQGERGVYAHEEWTFSRRKDAKSRTPDKAKVIGCPNCGAPLDVVAAGVCRHCQANVTGGAFDWVVDNITVLATEQRGPMLTSTVAEEGTDLPTIVDPAAAARFQQLEANDPQTNWQGVSGRLAHVFTEFQTAWAARDIAKMRPFMSDALFSTQTFWIEEYKRQGLRNITENAQISNLQLASVTNDAFYDAVTIRLWAQSLDYTVADATNQIVSGDRSKPRRYTEYWTLIRGRGAKGPAHADKACPKCGAPLNVTMGGNCTYCQAKVTSGEFDWVLSRIEQDEVYRG